MIIKKLILKNFRGYADSVIEFGIDSPVNESPNQLFALIAKNDVGKSTILEALDIFLDGGMIKIDPSDCNVHSTVREITIGAEFQVDKTKEYNFDPNVPTSLLGESLLNESGNFEIHKVWNCSNRTITSSSLSTYINAHYFSEFSEKPLICMKNTDLKKELKDRDLTCDDKNVNSKIRQAIYSAITNREKQNIMIQIDQSDSKKTWDYIKNELPMFFLFQSDRANKDSDKEVQDPLKVITKQAIAAVQSELDNIKRNIEEKINEVASQTLEKLKDMSPAIAKTLKPDITHKAWESLFNFSFQGDDNIPINKRGSGVRRLILLNYFRAEAERKNPDGRNTIYAIEEPETSQHPDHQRMLIEALQELAEQKKTQVFITTHSPEIAKLCHTGNLIHLMPENGNITVDTSEYLLKNIADTLGIMPYLSRFSIFVEGKNDVIFLRHIGENISELKSIFDLEQHRDVQILPVLGGNIEHWVNLNYVGNSNIKGFYLVDRDEQKYEKIIEGINDADDQNKGARTEFLMMENYIAPSLIERQFSISFTDEEKSNWGTHNIVNLIVQKVKRESNDVKNILCKKVVQQITKASIEEIGAWDEVRGWFEKINEMYKNK